MASNHPIRTNFTKKGKEEFAAKSEEYMKALEKERAAKRDYKQARKAEIERYKSDHEKTSKMYDIADKKWDEVHESYKALGKNTVQRMIAVSKTQSGKSDVAKDYLKKFDEAENASNKAYNQWVKTKQEYIDLGKTRIGRVIAVSKN